MPSYTKQIDLLDDVDSGTGESPLPGTLTQSLSDPEAGD